MASAGGIDVTSGRVIVLILCVIEWNKNVFIHLIRSTYASTYKNLVILVGGKRSMAHWMWRPPQTLVFCHSLIKFVHGSLHIENMQATMHE